jgi:hypothetical protein
MSRIYLFLYFLSGITLLNGQSNALQLVSGGGGLVQSGNIKGSFTIGETIVSTGRSSNNILTQGFQQTSIFITSTTEIPRVSQIKVFPNPFRESISFSYIQFTEIERIVLLDLKGRIVHQQLLPYTFHTGEESLTIQLPLLPPGLYVFQVFGKGQQLIDNYSLIKI